MGLTANREVNRYVDQELRRYCVAGAAHVFKGGFVGARLDGYVRPLLPGDRCVGLAYEEGDNAAGADGDVSVRVFTLGDFDHLVAGAMPGDVGRPVYAMADNALTFNPDGTSFVGYVQDCVAPDMIILRLVLHGPVGAARINHHARDFSLTPADTGTVHTNRGATGIVTATLPAAAPDGTELRFVCMTAQPLRLVAESGGGIVIKGVERPVKTYVSINEVGDFVHLVAAGRGEWIAVASSIAAGAGWTT